MTEFPKDVLHRVAEAHGTPCYVYLIDSILQRFSQLQDAFGLRLPVSYAVKANPSIPLLREIRSRVATLDCSSIAEVDRGLAAGYPAETMTFSGPAKRVAEMQAALELGVGSMICESVWEMEQLNKIAVETDRRVNVIPRINPKSMPRNFGVNMAGKPSQFGIDEEEAELAIAHLEKLTHLQLIGFHIYSGTNSLDEVAISDNFQIFIDLFQRLSKASDLFPKKLIFGSGFGIPYHDNERPLDLPKLSGLINPQIDALKRDRRFAGTQCVLEMGRWLVGPHGYLLTTVIGQKTSRGTKINLCDAGFNNHLAACGMMGTVIRRNWPIAKITPPHGGLPEPCTLTGPLCTTIDQIATALELPPLHRGDVIAIGSSGAYGLTASPTRFISHPEPLEFLVRGYGEEAEILDITESYLNHSANSRTKPFH